MFRYIRIAIGLSLMLPTFANAAPLTCRTHFYFMRSVVPVACIPDSHGCTQDSECCSGHCNYHMTGDKICTSR